MPEHEVLKTAAVWLLDVARLCAVVKPALFDILEFSLFLFALVVVVRRALRTHQ